ncbi:RHS repeat domain-containing protein [Maridesulfovibrio salexigens]|uniref:Teneurin-like YD-shell domain-containing protein n=1 Tax=Maridesulfovibrio salexigens (strain ATCC 14822 / DSM 2638 / NCIMB 8403 / VKM B-1763) TaxID=526222 RepID=C6BY15_MARSD|nr:RHS repeat-associated core domain-containing protein [Maridesulfovibrio salexigens]ACS80545.1 hypothetical protein Desal_2489 [Maridesulfovibrio salexigens DSM 2638]
MSLVGFANAEGNEVKRIIRDSFGNQIVDTNKRMDISLGFAAGLFDKDTGLVHFGFREYDPSIGRFITPDPLGLAGGDVDVYGYCADDPVNFIDRVGLQDESEDEGTKGEKSSTLGGAAQGIGGLTGLGKGVLSGLANSWNSGGNSTQHAQNRSQNAKNNATFEKGAQQSLDHLNQSSVQTAREMEKAYKELADKQQAEEKARMERKARSDQEMRDNWRRAGLKAKKDDFGLWDLAGGMAGGAVSGAAAFGALGGSVFGPAGTLAGAIAGGFYGSAMGGLKAVGSKALSDKLGVDRKDMEDAFGILGSAKPSVHKKDFK